jgi:hypothetical protein
MAVEPVAWPALWHPHPSNGRTRAAIYRRRVSTVAVRIAGSPFDKLIAVDLQFRLTRQALETDAVTVSKGLNPAEPDLTDADRSTHDRIFGDALRFLYDAGCRFFYPTVDTAVVPKQSRSLRTT